MESTVYADIYSLQLLLLYLLLSNAIFLRLNFLTPPDHLS